jgi:hypothetical protein
MKSSAPIFFALLFSASLSAHAGTPIINLSIGGEISPGVYGQVQFGNGPPPPLLYAKPTIISRQPPNAVLEPLYLHVPPGHAKHWAKHCREYNACGRPVYFVKSAEYEPGFRERRDMMHRDRGNREEYGRDEGRGSERGGGNEWRGDDGRKDKGRKD